MHKMHRSLYLISKRKFDIHFSPYFYQLLGCFVWMLRTRSASRVLKISIFVLRWPGNRIENAIWQLRILQHGFCISRVADVPFPFSVSRCDASRNYKNEIINRWSQWDFVQDSDRLHICGTCSVDAAYVSNVAKVLARLSVMSVIDTKMNNGILAEKTRKT